jgi:ketosteroid isomerase-like protein
MTDPSNSTVATETPELSFNAAVLYSAYEEFNRTGEIPEDLFDPEVEFVQMDGFAGTGTNKGIEGVRNVLSNLLANFESLKMRPRQVLDEQGNDVLMLVAITALAKGSRIQVKETMFHSWQMKNGRIARWQAFAEADAAREAWSDEPDSDAGSD